MERLGRRLLLGFIVLLISLGKAQGQQDSVPSWAISNIGFAYSDGLVQYFEGYDHTLLIANSSSGLPLYADWDLYTRFSTTPGYFRTGGFVQWRKPTKKLSLRLGLTYAQRSDTLLYGSSFEVRDTIWGRSAAENARLFGVNLSLIRETDLLAKFIRLQVGVQGEFIFGPRSKIEFVEYAYDAGEMRLVEFNEFEVIGNPRFAAYASALLGMEICFLKRFSLLAEVQSGLGLHMVINEKPRGMSRTLYSFGMSYYLNGY